MKRNQIFKNIDLEPLLKSFWFSISFVLELILHHLYCYFNWISYLSNSLVTFVYTLVMCDFWNFMWWTFEFLHMVAQMVKCLPIMREAWVWFWSRKDPLEKEMAKHSSTLAWKIPWMEEPGRLQSMGSQRVRHDWATSPYLTLAAFKMLNLIF